MGCALPPIGPWFRSQRPVSFLIPMYNGGARVTPHSPQPQPQPPGLGIEKGFRLIYPSQLTRGGSDGQAVIYIRPRNTSPG